MTESNTPPPFDTVFDEEDIEQRIYSVVIQTRLPTGASEVAELADCDPKTARKYLTWFAELGVVTKHDGRPTTYERNDAYFEWRRVNEIASRHSIGAIQRRVSELSEKIVTYRETYDVDTPGEVSVLEYDHSRVEDVYEELSDWETALKERQLYERARQWLSNSTAQTHG